MRTILFDLLLFGSCGYALGWGRPEARLVALTCIVANFASYALASHYDGVELGVLVIDILAFAAFTGVAVRSDRFWPLWVAGLQLTTAFGHVIKAIETDLVPIAYAVSLRMWSYPILVILALATWRGRQRMRPPTVPIRV